MVRVHVTLVKRMIAAIAAMPWRARLVQLGSMYEYGPVPAGVPIGESTPPRPATLYSETKLLGSQAVQDAAKAGDADGVVLRISNAIGPGVPRRSLPGQVCEQLLAAAGTGRPAVLRLAPLRDQRDFVDVGDLAQAIRAAIWAPVGGRVINIGSGRVVSVRTLVDLLIAASRIPAEVIEVEPAHKPRSAGLDWQGVDVGTARRLLGWAPRRRLEESLPAVWNAFVDSAGRPALRVGR
jgi:nucleoside-diphosphate-sugar epimerase